MTNYRVATKWIVSPDGTVVSQARSVASSVGDRTEIEQRVSVNVSSGGCSSSSSSSSSSSAVSRSGESI
ncbi:MAG: hypothetical protein AAF757_13780 [Cyanobacteria bacterium P01_D01_bin.116]